MNCAYLNALMTLSNKSTEFSICGILGNDLFENKVVFLDLLPLVERTRRLSMSGSSRPER